MTRKKTQTVTMKLNNDGTITMRSTGGFDLRKVMNPTADRKYDDIDDPGKTGLAPYMKDADK